MKIYIYIYIKFFPFCASENQFKIDLDEDGKLRTLEYETKTAYECAEIVYKLRYIMKGKR